ncbi:MAG: ATP-binding protein [bacterium]
MKTFFPFKKNYHIKTKITFILVFFTILSLGVIFSFSFFYSQKVIKDGFKSRLLDVVSEARMQINPKEHSILRTTTDESTTAYKDVLGTLKSIQANASDIFYVYTMRENINNQITFIVDGDDSDPNNISHIGDVYTDASEFLKNNFLRIDKPVVESEFYTDQWGTWLSGYAPFYDSDGKREGVLGMDISAASILKIEKQMIYYFMFVFLILILSLVFILNFLIDKNILKPIKKLYDGVGIIIHGDMNYKIEVDTKDEFGGLAKVFSDMVSANKNMNYEVEERIKSQTTEISAKAQELDSQKKAILNILEDVQKEKLKIDILAKDLEKFKLAVDNATDQIVITDKEGIVVYANKIIETITGYSPEETVGKKSGILWGMQMPKEYYQNMWDIIKNQKRVFHSVIKNRRKSGEFYFANISISPVLDNRGDIVFFVGLERDVTREKEIDRAKTEFVSIASHQLRSPLSAISWYTEMLLDGDAGKINKEQKKYLEEVMGGNKRMVDLVDSLLNVSRLDIGTFFIELELLNIVDMAKSVVSEFEPQMKSKKIKLEGVYGEDIGEFKADKKLLRMVLQNLLSNAVKYSKNEGKVKVELFNLQKGQKFGGRNMDKDSMTIKISDSGIGIPQSQKNMIFSKMFRADNARKIETQGTGLGLYIVKSISDLTGGMIWFESEEDKGTTFYVSFPSSGMTKEEGSNKLDSFY